ncbi:hypothetical protein ABFX02_10G148200 [Erythranthe guttata]
MGNSDLLEIGIKLRKGVIFTIKGVFRSVCNHPFLVGMLCFLILLHRSFPFVFSLLLSTSPILVCTAVLLGVLLSYGQPNIPEIEIEEKKTFESVSIKTGVSLDTAGAVVEKNESYFVERFSGVADQSAEHPDFSAPLIEERSREIESNEGEIWEEHRGLEGLRYKQKMDDEFLDRSDDEKSEADSFDSEMVNVDSLDSPPRSPWTRVEEREYAEREKEEREYAAREKEEREKEEEDGEDEEVEEEEEDDDSDSGSSSRAESSSPDASMADIMPMLDELHPLLDEEPPQPVHISRGGSVSASETSLKSSSTTTHESDNETETHEDLEVADDENEDENEDKEEQTKSAITWTEEDQKNLMDLGSSEIERNQRLENLILRRRLRKNTASLLAERNLIDFESSDLPFNIAPISTRRQNPFENIPQDSYYDVGLPPIPGSAPSILLQRRNPFDIPYDSSEEKPNLVGEGFQEEFVSQSREAAFFRRHESFNVRPSSIFAPSRNLRPYFVPVSEDESSSYSLFQRQSSELSESKVSSVPETESVSSVADLEERKLSEEDSVILEVDPIPWTKEEIEAGPPLDQENEEEEEIVEEEEEVVEEEEEEVVEEEEVNQEPETISSKIECVSEHVGHGSQSSDDEEEDSKSSNYSRSSSLSEVSERVFIDPEISAENNDFPVENTLLVDEVQPREPVYDSSPRRGVSRNISSSSISSDVIPVHAVMYNDGVDTENAGPDKNIVASLESLEERVVKPIAEHLSKVQESSNKAESPKSNIPDSVNELDSDTSLKVNSRSIETNASTEITTSSHVVDVQTTVEEAVEFEEIDEEELLSELDNVGDFSIIRAVEANSVNSRENKEEETDYISEPQISETRAELIDVSRKELNERELEREYSPDREYSSEDKTLSEEENKVQLIIPRTYVPEPEVGSTEDVDSVSEKAELVTSAEAAVAVGDDVIHRGQVVECKVRLITPTVVNHSYEEEKISEVPELKVGSAEAVDSVSEKNEAMTSAEAASVVGDGVIYRGQVEENEAQLITPAVVNHSSEEDKISEVSELKVGSTEAVDSVSDKNEAMSSAEAAALVGDDVIYRGQVEENEAQLITPTVVNHSYENDKISEVPELKVGSTEDIDSVSEKAELVTSAETVVVVGDDVIHRGQVGDTSDKTVLLEPPRAELVVRETVIEESDNGLAPNTKSSVVGPTHEKSILEFRQAEEVATMDYKQPNESSTGEVHHTTHVVVGPIPSEDTNFPPKQVLDAEAPEKLEPISEDASVQVKTDEKGTDKEIEAPNQASSDKGKKGKASKSSSSSSSSSSESSSSDSDKE